VTYIQTRLYCVYLGTLLCDYGYVALIETRILLS